MFPSTQLQKTSIFFSYLNNLIRDVLIPLVFTLGLLLFFWGVVKYIKSEGQGKEDGKKIMIWGVIALFVMSSIWGIIYFISDEFGLDRQDSVPVPTIRIDQQ